MVAFSQSQGYGECTEWMPAPGCPAPEQEVKALKIVKLDVFEQAPGCPN